MITDNQIHRFVDLIKVQMNMKSQTPFSAVANALAEYEYSKWIEFSPYNDSTWPTDGTPVMTNLGYWWLFHPQESEGSSQDLEWEVTKYGCTYKENARVKRYKIITEYSEQ